MAQIGDENSRKSQYLSELLSICNRNDDIGSRQAENLIQTSIFKIQKEIKNGETPIEKQISINQLTKQVKEKKDKFKREIEFLDKEIMENQELYKQAKRQILKQRKIEQENQKEENEQRTKQIQQKVRKWTELQKELKAKRQVLEQLRTKKQAEEQQRSKKQEEQQKAFFKLQKQKFIEQNIRKIQQNKRKRSETLKNAINQLQTLNPKFIEIQKKFKQLQEEAKFQAQIAKKQHKLSMKFDHQALKAHEKQYLTKISERRNNSPHSTEESRTKQEFKIFVNRDEQKNNEELKKLKRRKEFQEKIKEIPITIDEAKKVKIQIAIDKSKNPLKYNFLGQKALNQLQIFGEFQNFDIKIDAKELGNNYLRELPSIQKTSRIQKSQSVSSIPRINSQRIKYKDYLKEMKANRQQRNEEQVEQIPKTHKQKQKLIEQLNNKSKKYDLQVLKKREEKQMFVGFKTTLKKSKQIDQMYMKSIKAKIACLEMV